MRFLKEYPVSSGIKEAMANVAHREELDLPVIDFSIGNAGKMIIDSGLFSKFQIEVNDELAKPLRLIGEALKIGLLNSFYEKTAGLPYTPAGGTDSVKLLVLKYFKKFHGIPLSDGDLNRVIATAGGQQALSASLRAIKSGTTIYMNQWEYSPASEIVKENDCQEVRIPIDDGLSIQIDFLRENVKDSSVFYISMPNNPTGYTSPKDLGEILDIMAEKDGGIVKFRL